MLGLGSAQKIEQFCDGDKHAFLAGKPAKEASEPRIYSPSLAETFCEMRVHDAYPALRFQTVLVRFVYPFTKVRHIGSLRTREPKVHERLGRVMVREGRIDARNIDLVDGKVADILDMLFAEVAPKIRRTFDMTLIGRGSFEARPYAAR